MRSIRIIGLAAVAALMAISAVGVTSASAGAETVLCKANVEYCQGTNVSGYAFTSAQVEAKFNFGEAGSVTCTSQMIRNEEERISTLSFIACGEGCTVTASGLPYFANMFEPIAGNGKMSMTIGGLNFKCGTSECVYKGFLSNLPVEGGTPANVHVNASLKEEAGSFFCPESVQWEADYKFKVPSTATYVTKRGVEGPVFCSVNESPCPQKSVKTFNEFPSKGNITIGLFPGSTQITCTSGGFALNNFSPYKVGGEWNYKPFGLSGCTSPIYTGCVLSMESPPYIGVLEPSGKGSGTVKVSETPSHVPTLSVKCSSGGTPFTCVYTAKSFTLKFTGGVPAALSTSTALTRQSGSATFCSTSVTLTGEYQTAGGSALYMESS